jgi:hypothetical protein
LNHLRTIAPQSTIHNRYNLFSGEKNMADDYRFNVCAHIRIHLKCSGLSNKQLLQMFHRFVHMAAESLGLEDTEPSHLHDQAITDYVSSKKVLLITAREFQIAPKDMRKVLALVNSYFYEIDQNYGIESWIYYAEELY